MEGAFLLAVARKMTAFLVVSGNRGLSISRVFRRGRYRVCSEVLRPRCVWDDQYLRSCRSMHVDVLTMHAVTIRWTYFSTDSSSVQVRQMQSKPYMHAPRCLWVAICHLQGVTPGPERPQRHTISSWSVSTSINSDLFSLALVIPLCCLLAFIIRPSRELRAPTTCLSAGGLD